MNRLSGSRVGPYEILAPLGAGGMGEVYRARDPRLDREVAIKVLPSELAHDPERLRRFAAEAHAASALNHPNILAVHEFGEEQGSPYLVTELLAGETLRERLAAGALRPRKAVEAAVQIARGLAAAHDHGIVHRDLKPENIFLARDGQVKILDFGLARRDPPALSASALGRAPTLVLGTDPGTVLGTVGYMAPEQVRCATADARADLFALGCVLYEMLCGRRAFQRASRAETLSAILRDEPPPFAVDAADLPPQLERLVFRCLEKNPAERFQSAHDLAFDLESLAVTPSASSAGPEPTGQRPWLRRGVATAALAVAALVVGFVLGRWQEPRQAPRRGPVRLLLQSPEGTTFYDTPVISPDGRQVAFLARDTESRYHLYARSLDVPTAVRHADVVDVVDAIGARPFWSPDSRAVGLCDGRKVRVVTLASGDVRSVADCTTSFRGGAWGRDGTILFAPRANGPLLAVPASGGVPRPVTSFEEEVADLSHRFPAFLPDGHRFVFLAHSNAAQAPEEALGLFVGDLKTGRARKVSGERWTNAAVVQRGAQSWLLLHRNRSLLAFPFDLRELELRGEAVLLEADIQASDGGGYAGFSASPGGDVVTVAGPSGLASRFTFADRAGTVIIPVEEFNIPALGIYEEMVVAGDARRAAAVFADPQQRLRDLWVIDLTSGTATRLTAGPYSRYRPVWHPDGRTLGFSAAVTGRDQPYAMPADGSGRERRLAETPHRDRLAAWSPDGGWILLERGVEGGRIELWARSLAGAQEVPICQVAGDCQDAALSPDGRFFAFASNHSGRSEIYVRPFLRPGGQVQISTAGGSSPHWRADGRELIYRDPAGWRLAVAVSTADDFVAEPPQRLAFLGSGLVAWLPDHTRLLGSPPGIGGTTLAHVLLDWAPD